jgi:hypothetical protein
MEYARKKYLAVRVARAGGVELVTRAGDKEDQLTLMLASPSHGIETVIAKCCEEKSVLVFSMQGILPVPLQGREKEVYVTVCL